MVNLERACASKATKRGHLGLIARVHAVTVRILGSYERSDELRKVSLPKREARIHSSVALLVRLTYLAAAISKASLDEVDNFLQSRADLRQQLEFIGDIECCDEVAL